MRTINAALAGATLTLAACVHTGPLLDTNLAVSSEVASKRADTIDVAGPAIGQVAASDSREAHDSARLENSGFLHRASTIRGAYFVTPEKIAAMQPRRIADLFRHIPVMLEQPNPSGRQLLSPQGCFVTYVNGLPRRTGSPSTLDTFIQVREVVAAEVYPPGQLAPAPFTRSNAGSGCTTVGIWTRA